MHVTVVLELSKSAFFPPQMCFVQITVIKKVTDKDFSFSEL